MKKLILASVLSLFSGITMAHPGHGLESAYAGLMHPLTGIDHLLVMLAVGWWAAKLGGRARWQLPVVFVAFMAIGAIFGLNLGGVSELEILVAISVIAMGALLSTRMAMKQIWQCCIVASFAIFHGLAHGIELQTHVQWSSLLAMMVATALLHAFGYWFGVQRQDVFARLQQVFAMAMMLIGGYLLTA